MSLTVLVESPPVRQTRALSASISRELIRPVLNLARSLIPPVIRMAVSLSVLTGTKLNGRFVRGDIQMVRVSEIGIGVTVSPVPAGCFGRGSPGPTGVFGTPGSGWSTLNGVPGRTN